MEPVALRLRQKQRQLFRPAVKSRVPLLLRSVVQRVAC